MLLFTIDGTEYEFDRDKLPLTEAIAVKKAAGITVADFMFGLKTMDPEALKAMVWLARLRGGEKIRYDDIEFDVIAFVESLRYVDEKLEETEPDEAEPDSEHADGEVPTTPGPSTNGSGTGTTPPSGEPATSQPSPSTSD